MALQEEAAQRLPVSEFMNLVSGHSVELLGYGVRVHREVSAYTRQYNTGQNPPTHKHRPPNTHHHHQWNLRPRTQRSSSRTLYSPQTATFVNGARDRLSPNFLDMKLETTCVHAGQCNKN